MKKIGLCLGLLFLISSGFSCADRGADRPAPTPRCINMDIPSENYEAVEIYQKTDPDSCLAVVFPFDAWGWFESANMSRQLRDQTIIQIGCVKSPSGAGASSAAFVGCNTAFFNFDLSLIPEDVEIVTAQLAIFALENKEALSSSVLQGRMNIGSDMTVISDSPLLVGSWALYDVVGFVSRGVTEKRNSVSLRLDLPLDYGSRTKIALSQLDRDWAPALLIEYR